MCGKELNMDTVSDTIGSCVDCEPKFKNEQFNEAQYTEKRKAWIYQIYKTIPITELTYDKFISWYMAESKICCYCGATLIDILKKYPKQKMFIVGLKDFSKGYTLDNICLSCPDCNDQKIFLSKSTAVREQITNKQSEKERIQKEKEISRLLKQKENELKRIEREAAQKEKDASMKLWHESIQRNQELKQKEKETTKQIKFYNSIIQKNNDKILSLTNQIEIYNHYIRSRTDEINKYNLIIEQFKDQIIELKKTNLLTAQKLADSE